MRRERSRRTRSPLAPPALVVKKEKSKKRKTEVFLAKMLIEEEKPFVGPLNTYIPVATRKTKDPGRPGHIPVC